LDAADPGNRVHTVRFDGEPIDPHRMFTVAISDAMGQGKFGYTWFAEAERVMEAEFGALVASLVKQWLDHHKGTNVNPSMGRITFSPRPEVEEVFVPHPELYKPLRLIESFGDEPTTGPGRKLRVVLFSDVYHLRPHDLEGPAGGAEVRQMAVRLSNGADSSVDRRRRRRVYI
jgi:hypothetical protein